MAQEMVGKIRKAEQQAEKIITDAKQKVLEIQASVLRESNAVQKQAKEKAARKAEQAILEAEKQAAEISAAAEKKAAEKALEMQAQVSKRREEVARAAQEILFS